MFEVLIERDLLGELQEGEDTRPVVTLDTDEYVFLVQGHGAFVKEEAWEIMATSSTSLIEAQQNTYIGKRIMVLTNYVNNVFTKSVHP